MKKQNGTEKLPNIIYILADDMGYGDISALNENSKINTPNLDKMISEGLCFTDAHSSSAVCTPSRYSILTGRYNWRSTLKNGVLMGYSPHLIEEGRITVASMLKEAGYRTYCVGKWHLGVDWVKTGEQPDEVDFTQPIKNGPTAYGFDYFYGISASLDMPPYVYIEDDRVTQVPSRRDAGNAFPFAMKHWREGFCSEDFKHEEVLPRCTDKVLNIIEDQHENPFFLYFPLTAPHTPVLPTKEFRGKSGTNDYGDFVLMCDDLTGHIMKKLEEKGIAENTILVYTSDNGCSPAADLPQLSACGHNPSYIFRGHKADIYEGGHRIPLIVKWPERIKAGTISNEPVCLSDLFATIADITGYRTPEDAAEDSVSNLPVWLGENYNAPLREAIVHHSINGSFSIRRGKWKLELCPGSGGWSYPKPGQEEKGAPSLQLYDLESDVSERYNVVDRYPEVVAELRNLLTKYIFDGRSTPGNPQRNTGPKYWNQLSWIEPALVGKDYPEYR